MRTPEQSQSDCNDKGQGDKHLFFREVVLEGYECGVERFVPGG